MPQFSSQSAAKLATCHPDLQRLFNAVIQTYDCIILEGHRNRTAQEAAFAAGKTELHYPHGNHNKIPSQAVDAMPYPIVWNDTQGIKAFAAFVLATASQLDIPITWGGSWETLVDMPHYELKQQTGDNT